DARSARPDWRITDQNGTIVWRGLGASTQALLPPGTYTVAVGRDPIYRQQVEVKRGANARVRFKRR
ncbi:MAG: hypothetical protein AAGG99_05935, partial [Pseudomonadota bacterium]